MPKKETRQPVSLRLTPSQLDRWRAITKRLPDTPHATIGAIIFGVGLDAIERAAKTSRSAAALFAALLSEEKK